MVEAQAEYDDGCRVTRQRRQDYRCEGRIKCTLYFFQLNLLTNRMITW